MRYSVFSRTLSPDEVESLAIKAGATGVRHMAAINQLFCEMTRAQATQLDNSHPDIRVKPVRATRSTQLAPPIEAISGSISAEAYDVSMIFTPFRDSYVPPITGDGLTVAVLDSGIRDTHESLAGKVVAEANYSGAPSASDLFGHGTGVAFLIAGGAHGDALTGVAPGAKLVNVKVLTDQGIGTDEMLIEGINAVCEMVADAISSGKPSTDDEYPNVLNISVGGDDDGDGDNPVRVACQNAVQNYGLQIVAAAGNDGPTAGTILIPACDPLVVAVGGMATGALEVWDYSARGPSEEGAIKPDFVAWATNLRMASHIDNESYCSKSGTSFAAPILSGLIGLIWELGRRNFGADWMVTWYDVEAVGPYVCMKADGAPYQKDNEWGYGLPAPNLMATGAGTSAPTTDMSGMVGMMMVMMMMMPLMKAANG